MGSAGCLGWEVRVPESGHDYDWLNARLPEGPDIVA